MATPAKKGFSLAAVGHAALILTAAAAAVQLIGFGRELYVAAQVGVSAELDALIIGIALPVMLSGVFVAGLRTALVPSYLDARESHGTRQARRVAGALFLGAGAGGIVLTALLYLAAEPIVALTGPGLDALGRESAASYLRVVAPAALFSALSTVPFAVCQAEERFRAIAFSVVAGPLVTVVFMLLTWESMGLESLAVGTLIGHAVSPALLLGATARYGVAPIPTLPSRGLGLRAYVHHALPLTVAALILRLNAIFDRAIASIVLSGGVGVLRYADSLIRSPIGALSPAWGGAVYPALVQSAQQEGGSQLGSATDRTVRFTLSAFTPISFLSAAVAPVAVSAVYSRGAFTSDDVRVVASVVAAFAPIIAILMTSSVVTNALNARRSSMVLLASSVINVGINLALDLVLGFAFGIVGIALASSLTMATMLLFKASRLAKLEDGFTLRMMARTAALASIASLPAALVIASICWSGWIPAGFLPGIISLVIFGVAGLATYLVVATLIGLREPRELASFAWGLVRRRAAAR